MKTTSEKIRQHLNRIAEQSAKLVRELPIKRFDKNRSSGIVFIAPDYYWGEITPAQRNEQLQLKKDYDNISEHVRFIFKDAPKDVRHRLEQADKLLTRWIYLEENWSIRPDPEANAAKLLKDSEEIKSIIDILDASKDKSVTIIPDTNSLLNSCDPLSYRATLKEEQFTLLLLPTVLKELDELKILHRNPDVRDKAKKIISRIKGWRTQGSLANGITVEKNITIKSIATEPDMENTLSWLDKDASDDRIIASVLEIQSHYPAAVVILFTGDINLQNKAEAAMIEFLELDDA